MPAHLEPVTFRSQVIRVVNRPRSEPEDFSFESPQAAQLWPFGVAYGKV